MYILHIIYNKSMEVTQLLLTISNFLLPLAAQWKSAVKLSTLAPINHLNCYQKHFYPGPEHYQNPAPLPPPTDLLRDGKPGQEVKAALLCGLQRESRGGSHKKKQNP
jgi:hypothetical protein